MKLPIFTSIIALILTTGLLSAQTIEISTDKGSYESGDAIEVSLAASNGPTVVVVDLYYVLLNPAGELLFFPSWSTTPTAIEDLSLTPNFNLPKTKAFTYNLPSLVPLINVTGTYTLAVGFATPNTLNFLSVDSAAFSYTAGESNTGAYVFVDLDRDYSIQPPAEDFTAGFGVFEYESSEPEECPELDDCITSSYEGSTPPGGVEPS